MQLNPPATAAASATPSSWFDRVIPPIFFPPAVDFYGVTIWKTENRTEKLKKLGVLCNEHGMPSDTATLTKERDTAKRSGGAMVGSRKIHPCAKSKIAARKIHSSISKFSLVLLELLPSTTPAQLLKLQGYSWLMD